MTKNSALLESEALLQTLYIRALRMAPGFVPLDPSRMDFGTDQSWVSLEERRFRLYIRPPDNAEEFRRRSRLHYDGKVTQTTLRVLLYGSGSQVANDQSLKSQVRIASGTENDCGTSSFR